MEGSINQAKNATSKRIFIGGIPIKMDESIFWPNKRNPQRVFFNLWSSDLFQSGEKQKVKGTPGIRVPGVQRRQ